MLNSLIYSIAILFLSALNYEPHFSQIPEYNNLIPGTIIEEKKQNEKVLICISNTSYRYHLGMCKGMNACSHERKWLNKSLAINMGKTFCGFCARGQYES